MAEDALHLTLPKRNEFKYKYLYELFKGINDSIERGLTTYNVFKQNRDFSKEISKYWKYDEIIEIFEKQYHYKIEWDFYNHCIDTISWENNNDENND